jgi:hypothetical protein
MRANLRYLVLCCPGSLSLHPSATQLCAVHWSISEFGLNDSRELCAMRVVKGFNGMLGRVKCEPLQLAAIDISPSDCLLLKTAHSNPSVLCTTNKSAGEVVYCALKHILALDGAMNSSAAGDRSIVLHQPVAILGTHMAGALLHTSVCVMQLSRYTLPPHAVQSKKWDVQRLVHGRRKLCILLHLGHACTSQSANA